ncbi:hypothetical protein H9655_11320 [Cytobacillus sp. Sa5YUA1]|uniref:Uncharacterized protein n=1 Tax=Cytobacillus stercorigallinarum TaxID=2762240 RepID=A0ABR8QPZ9_9BACI|nr:hypothetical protein [Cytobacillus stercorigallinarum]MBD7937614.1 hypothetical protein [Cytobacillus stercorigallinarum]
MNEEKRDPGRIKRLLYLLQEIWESNPDMRFFQLIDLLKHEYSSENDGFGKREGFEIDSKGYKMPISNIDLFYLEDKEFEEFLQAYINQFGNRE